MVTTIAMGNMNTRVICLVAITIISPIEVETCTIKMIKLRLGRQTQHFVGTMADDAKQFSQAKTMQIVQTTTQTVII